MRLESLSLYFVLVISSLSFSQGMNSTFTRNKRYIPLIFQNPAAITFITGFGIPVHHLHPELVVVGMVLKAQQFLPTKYEALRQKANHSIHQRELEFEKKPSELAVNYRVLFYKALEQLSINLGQAGRACVLKMICEVAAAPFHYMNGVLGEIIHILLTPSSSWDTYQNRNQNNIYVKAEQIGHDQKKCAEHYTDCRDSILDRITSLFD